MANEFIARNGLISQNNSTVTGSLTVTQGITGSLLGTATTASYVPGSVFTSENPALSASYALTASYTPDYVLTSTTGSMLTPYVLTSTTSSMLTPYVLTSSTSSMNVLSASYALTASYVIGGTTLTTQEEGSTLSSTVTTLNFVGAGVVASGTGATTTVTIAGGGGSGGTSLGLVQAFSVGLQNIF